MKNQRIAPLKSYPNWPMYPFATLCRTCGEVCLLYAREVYASLIWWEHTDFALDKIEYTKQVKAIDVYKHAIEC